MEWAHLVVNGLGTVIWPVLIGALVLLFRTPIGKLLERVREAEFPGGITLRIDTVQEAVEQASTLGSSRPLAQLLDSLEVEIFRLADTVRVSREITRSPPELVRSLQRQGVISDSAATALSEFLTLISDLISRQETNQAAILRTLGLGEPLVAYLHHIRLVEYLLRDFEGHLLWQWDHPGEANRYRFWSAIASEAGRFDYDYDALMEAITRFNSGERQRTGRYLQLPPLRVEDYVRILKVRRSELQRVDSLRFHETAQNILWLWPEEWGDIGWNGPVVRTDQHHKPQEDIPLQLFRTERAIERYEERLRRGTRSSESG